MNLLKRKVQVPKFYLGQKVYMLTVDGIACVTVSEIHLNEEGFKYGVTKKKSGWIYNLTDTEVFATKEELKASL